MVPKDFFTGTFVLPLVLTQTALNPCHWQVNCGSPAVECNCGNAVPPTTLAEFTLTPAD